ncbi:hypoxanthine phosphoribosyltransferase [Desulfitibacter alkalitolerans]|uniref:hypoxanthine phosphoribosyltransferase n=1 Tax=Desulfitibacter alkalitolerans TaxID=264641 RepID=UPI000485BD20|nr:hypoxanthine phosphoribosyltransferase [Desulfitibacter alkalitolerans]
MKYGLDIIITQERIKQRVNDLGRQISDDYHGKKMVLVCVLRGAVYFTVDLTRSLTVPFVLDFISISSYGREASPQGIVRITKDLDISVNEKEVLLVEDIVDTGLTLNYLLRNLKTRNPSGIRVCTLLNVPARRIVEVPIDYVGFELPDVYAVGYGLDYHEQYRNMLDIAALVEEAGN